MLRLLNAAAFILFFFMAQGQQTELDTLENYFAKMPDDSIKVKAMSRMGLRIAGSNPDLAMKLGKQSIQLGEELNLKQTLAGSYGNIGVAFNILGYMDSTIIYCNKALDIAKKANDSTIMASLYTNLGRVYVELGRFEDAFKSQFAALAIDEARNDSVGLGYTYSGIGLSYSMQGKLEKSNEYLKKSLAIRTKLKNYPRMSNIYNNLGINYEKLGELDSALFFYGRALELTDSKSGIADNAFNVSLIFLKKKQYDTSIYFINKAISINRELNSMPNIGTGYLYLGTLYYLKNDFQKASNFLEQSKPLVKKYGYHAEIKQLYEYLHKVHLALRNHEKAYQYLSAYKILTDSINSLNTMTALEEIEEKYETEKKDKQITELELEKQTSSLALAQSNNQRNILIAFVVIISVVAILLFAFFRQKRKSLAEKELLLKEIHHRVKNNLQVISSLLNLQADSLESDVAKDAVKEGQHRVKSMALIHQKLYSADDIRGVDVQDYLENLSTELFRAFGVDQEKIKWKIDTCGLKLDIDTIIPLGLIINELITNAIKYAFNDLEDGLLQIEMKEDGENLNVLVADNGKGMNEEDIKKSNSFGWKMIQSLSRKLKAEVAISSDKGTHINLVLSRYKLVV